MVKFVIILNRRQYNINNKLYYDKYWVATRLSNHHMYADSYINNLLVRLQRVVNND